MSKRKPIPLEPNAGRIPNVSIRPAKQQDAVFVHDCARETMRNYVEQVWGPWDEEEQRGRTLSNFDANTHWIISFCDRDIGCISFFSEEDEHYQLESFYILAAFQNRGIGAALMKEMIEIAERAGKPIHLRVVSVNPAVRFYERHGFRVVRRTRERIFMEWTE